jgi:DNA-directed RNA polymerase specialized sigma24 family protein
MSAGAPQDFHQEVWEKYEQRIALLVREDLSKRTGYNLGPEHYHRNYDEIMKAVKSAFSCQECTDSLWVPHVASREVDRLVRKKQNELWDAHFGLVIATLEEAFPPLARGLDKRYTDFLLDRAFGQFVARYSATAGQDNLDQWLKVLVNRTVEAEILQSREEQELLSTDARQFCQAKQSELWKRHADLAAPIVKQALPPSAREFEEYYTNRLVVLALNQISAEFAYSDSNFEEWSNRLVRRVIDKPIRNITNDNGELRDEELVRLYRAGFPNCKTLLLERYQTKLRQLAPAIVYAKGICPESEDSVEFVKDVAQDVAVKLLTELDSYHFESAFETWVGAICENVARTKERKTLGRSKAGKRKYVSFEELKQQPTAPIIRDENHRAILRKIIDKHRQQGPRAEKSADAIELRHYEDMDSARIADRLQTTVAYVYQLFSHDYPELKRIALEDFGISGTDL